MDHSVETDTGTWWNYTTPTAHESELNCYSPTSFGATVTKLIKMW